jgi:integrase
VTTRERGEGAVFKTVKHGKVRFVAQLPGRNGKQFTGKTAKEALRKRREYQAQNATIAAAKPTTTTDLYLSAWLRYVAGTIKPATLNQYTWAIEKHITPVIGTLSLADVKTRHIDDVMQKARESDLSLASQGRIFATIRLAFKHARKHGLIATNPVDDADRPKRPTTAGDPMTEADLGKFLDTIGESRFEAAWLLGVGLGLTSAEICGLTWPNVTIRREGDTYAGELRIVQIASEATGRLTIGTPKAAARSATLLLPSICAEALSRWRVRQKEDQIAAGGRWQNPTDAVFTNQMGGAVRPSNLYAMFQRICKRAKLSRHYRLHQLRHTTASMLIADGQDIKTVQALMRHASASMTLNVYAGLMRSDGQAAESQDAALRRLRRS